MEANAVIADAPQGHIVLVGEVPVVPVNSFFPFFSAWGSGARGNDLPEVGVKSFKRACVCVCGTHHAL